MDSATTKLSHGITGGASIVNASRFGLLAAFAAQCQPCNKFEDLPYVLRGIIWELSLHPMVPRLVVVEYNVQTGRYITKAPPAPPQLQVCRQSRIVAREYYGIYFERFGACGRPAAVQINVDVDTVQLGGAQMRLMAVEIKIFEDIRHIALAGMDIQRSDHGINGVEDGVGEILRELCRFRSLESITIVSPPPPPPPLICFEKHDLANELNWIQLAHQLQHNECYRVSTMTCKRIVCGLHSDVEWSGKKVPKVFLAKTNADGVWEEAVELRESCIDTREVGT